VGFTCRQARNERTAGVEREAVVSGEPVRAVIEATTNSRAMVQLLERYGQQAGLDLTVDVPHPGIPASEEIAGDRPENGQVRPAAYRPQNRASRSPVPPTRAFDSASAPGQRDTDPGGWLAPVSLGRKR
jgi:hypothetical protein